MAKRAIRNRQIAKARKQAELAAKVEQIKRTPRPKSPKLKGKKGNLPDIGKTQTPEDLARKEAERKLAEKKAKIHNKNKQYIKDTLLGATADLLTQEQIAAIESKIMSLSEEEVAKAFENIDQGDWKEFYNESLGINGFELDDEERMEFLEEVLRSVGINLEQLKSQNKR